MEFVGGTNEFKQNAEQAKGTAERVSVLIRRGGGYEAHPDNPRVAYSLSAPTVLWLSDYLGEPLGQNISISREVVPEEFAQTGGWYSVIFDHELLVDTPCGKLPKYVQDGNGNFFSFDTHYFFHPISGAAFKIQAIFDASSIGDKEYIASIKPVIVNFSISSEQTKAAPIEQEDYKKIDAALLQIESVETITPRFPPPTPQP